MRGQPPRVSFSPLEKVTTKAQLAQALDSALSESRHAFDPNGRRSKSPVKVQETPSRPLSRPPLDPFCAPHVLYNTP
eukprot:1195275-Prorocentrum_minimum.AAC.2